MSKTYIEHPSIGATYEYDDYGVYEYSTYPPHSVLAGQERRVFLASFPTLDEAKKVYPWAEFVDHTLYTPVNLNHLPEEDK